MSDGFSRLVDTYHRYDPDTLLDRASEEGGIDRLLAELRDIERADPDCRAHLRIKPGDDATAMAEIGRRYTRLIAAWRAARNAAGS